MMQGPGGPGMTGAPPGGYIGQQGFGEPNKGYVNQGMYNRTGGGYAGGPGGYAGRWVLAFICFHPDEHQESSNSFVIGPLITSPRPPSVALCDWLKRQRSHTKSHCHTVNLTLA